MTIKAELEDFEGNRRDLLERVVLRQRSVRSVINGLVLLIPEKGSKIQVGATWLLKRLAETKSQFTTQQLTAIFDSLADLNHWEAKLHICQMLQHVRIPKGSEAKVALFLERSLLEENKFLRAWAYNGFVELAKQHTQYSEFAMKQLDDGETEKSAAVRARIRNIRKALKRCVEERDRGGGK
jgi:hypothetical protein